MSFITAAFLRRLSVAQREELIRHVAGAQPVVISKRGDDGRYQTIRKLVDLQLVRGDDSNRPRFTALTYEGREAAAAILAEYADALVGAGVLEEKLRPLDLVELIKADAVKDRLTKARGHDYDRHKNRQTFGRSQT